MLRMFMKVLCVIAVGLFFANCSTVAKFKIPDGTQLEIDTRPVELQADGTWETKPFFWKVAKGAPYKITKGGSVVQEGTIPMKFRVVSIFWPPMAIIYWPFGFREPEYSLMGSDNKFKVPEGGGKSEDQKEVEKTKGDAKKAKCIEKGKVWENGKCQKKK